VMQEFGSPVANRNMASDQDRSPDGDTVVNEPALS
jgi:hypothetical protein